MLTLKSDDMSGRAKAYESIIKQVDIINPKIPESFNILVKELQGLGLKIDLVDQDDQLVNAEEVLEVNLHQKNKDQPAIVMEEEAETTAAEQVETASSEADEPEEGGSEEEDLDEMINDDISFEKEFGGAEEKEVN